MGENATEKQRHKGRGIHRLRRFHRFLEGLMVFGKAGEICGNLRNLRIDGFGESVNRWREGVPPLRDVRPDAATDGIVTREAAV